MKAPEQECPLENIVILESDKLSQFAFDLSKETLLQSFLLGLCAISQKLCTVNYLIDPLSQLNAFFFNPSSPNSDQLQFSPNDARTLSRD